MATGEAAKAGQDPDNIAGGVAAALTAMFLYGLTETAAKYLTGGYHPTQILALRSLFALGLAAWLAFGAGGAGWSALRSQRPWLQVVRGFIAAVSMTMALFAYSMMPLADAVSVIYAAPILVTLLSAPFLGERLGWRRSLAVALGFVGVLLVVRPGEALYEPAALLALGSMTLYACSTVMTRALGRVDRGVTTLIYTQIAFLAICAPMQPLVWVTPTGLDAALFALVASAGAVAQYLLTLSYRYAPAAVVSPFDYTAILWATLFAFLVWGEAPALLTWVGMAVIIASGAYIAIREILIAPRRNAGPVDLVARGGVS